MADELLEHTPKEAQRVFSFIRALETEASQVAADEAEQMRQEPESDHDETRARLAKARQGQR